MQFTQTLVNIDNRVVDYVLNGYPFQLIRNNVAELLPGDWNIDEFIPVLKNMYWSARKDFACSTFRNDIIQTDEVCPNCGHAMLNLIAIVYDPTSIEEADAGLPYIVNGKECPECFNQF